MEAVKLSSRESDVSYDVTNVTNVSEGSQCRSITIMSEENNRTGLPLASQQDSHNIAESLSSIGSNQGTEHQ